MPAAFSLMQATLPFSAASCVSFERLAPHKPKNICRLSAIESFIHDQFY